MRFHFGVLGMALAAACGSDDASPSGGGDACNSLCTGASFTSGAATNFGGGLVECVCAGAGKGVAKAACESYCAGYNVPAAKAYLSMANVANDKCVCDGTTPGH